MLFTGRASAVKTQRMGVRIEVTEGEDIHEALRRFRAELERARHRPWYKKSRGFHESAGQVGRKRRYVDRLKRTPAGPRNLYLRMGVERQLFRSNPCLGAWGRGQERHWAWIVAGLRREARLSLARLRARRDGWWRGR
jgi:ribosomal protein S21